MVAEQNRSTGPDKAAREKILLTDHDISLETTGVWAPFTTFQDMFEVL